MIKIVKTFKLKYKLTFSTILALTLYMIGITAGVLSKNLIVFDTANRMVVSANAMEIFSHNMLINLYLLSGFIFLGTITIVFALYEAFNISIVIAKGLSVSPLLVVSSILPHAFFEIPAVIIAATAGLITFEVLIRHLRGGEFIKKRDIKRFLKLLSISTLLTFLGAIVEAYITPTIIIKLGG